jgi:HSP20 family protein
MKNKMSLYVIIICLGFMNAAKGATEEDYLDWMIHHHKQGLERMKGYVNKMEKKEVKDLNQGMIALEEKELERMVKLRKELYPEREEMANEFISLRKNFVSEVRRLEDEMTKLFTHYEQVLKKSNHQVSSTPKMEIEETNNSYDIKAEVPGVARESLVIKLVENDLIIKGERKMEVKYEGKGKTSSEFYYGEFNRNIHLTSKVDPKSMKSTYKDGVLHVHIDKVKSSGAKQAAI